MQTDNTMKLNEDRPSDVELLKQILGTVVCAVSIFLIGVLSAYAQPAGPPRDAPPTPQDITKVLKLSAKQAPEVQAIIDAERREMHELREAMRAKADALHERTRQKLAKQLNAEQMGRFEEWREANRPPRPPASEGRPQLRGDQSSRDERRSGDAGPPSQSTPPQRRP
jgi:hypothetical protein